MNHLHIECVGGASGDMILGALVELGVPLNELKAALVTLPLGPFDIVTERTESFHISGRRLRVVVEGQEEAGDPAEPHDQHHHHHEHDDHHHHHYIHEHRALSDITAMIGAADFPADVKTNALKIFQALGEAESRIHGVPIEDIHFHEVGSADSILDIVGCCWSLHRLGITSVSIGAIPLGHGVIRCAHGVYPNPAPATIELIQGLPIVQVDEPFELVTPTGAALLAGWRTCDGVPAGSTLQRTAYSIGRRVLHQRPNVLRISLFVTKEAEEHDTCLMLECNLDDTTPEILGVLMEDVLAAGALDVTCTPVTMKKQRPGLVFSVLIHPTAREIMLDLVFRGSTTFGIREYPVHRSKLARRFESVNTPYGPVAIKVGTWRGDDITRSPEMADCQRAAREHNVPVRLVYEAARTACSVVAAPEE